MPPKFKNVGAYDAVRAMMDTLMGEGRDLPPDQRDSVKRRELADDDVDRFYLCGCSPYVVLTQTKSESMLPHVEPALVQDERLKKEWDALPQSEKDRYGFEYETMQFLEDMVNEMDRRIAWNRARLDAASGEPAEAEIAPEVVAQIQALKDQILELQVKAELAGEQGEIETTVRLSEEADQLGAKKAELEAAVELKKQQSLGRKQCVCPVSGLIHAANDSEARLAELQSGRQYRGWKAMRDRLAELKQLAPKRGAPEFSRKLGFGRVERERRPGERDDRAGPRPYEHRQREYSGSRSRERDDRGGYGGGYRGRDAYDRGGYGYDRGGGGGYYGSGGGRQSRERDDRGGYGYDRGRDTYDRGRGGGYDRGGGGGRYDGGRDGGGYYDRRRDDYDRRDRRY